MCHYAWQEYIFLIFPEHWASYSTSSVSPLFPKAHVGTVWLGTWPKKLRGCEVGRTELVHRISVLVFQSVGWDVCDLTRLPEGFIGEISGNKCKTISI